MPAPDWSEVRESLTAAMLDALPLQVRKVAYDRIARVGLHLDAFSGSAGLYLLSEFAALGLTSLDDMGTWPISTERDGHNDHAQAFASHWEHWSQWFRAHAHGLTEAERAERSRGLLQAAREAMRAVDAAGLLDALPKIDAFAVIIAEHDEAQQLSVERYVRIHSDGRNE